MLVALETDSFSFCCSTLLISDTEPFTLLRVHLAVSSLSPSHVFILPDMLLLFVTFPLLFSWQLLSFLHVSVQSSSSLGNFPWPPLSNDQLHTCLSPEKRGSFQGQRVTHSSLHPQCLLWTKVLWVFIEWMDKLMQQSLLVKTIRKHCEYYCQVAVQLKSSVHQWRWSFEYLVAQLFQA